MCIVDVPYGSLEMTGILRGRDNFRGIEGELPIKTVFTITCGSRDGTFSEDSATIRVVRENYDMTTEVTSKVWSVMQMRAAVGEMQIVPV